MLDEMLIVKLLPGFNELPDEVLRVAAQFGLTLEPMHPGVEDEALRTYFFSAVNAPRELEHAIVDSLLQCKSVDGSYIKSPGSEPE